MTTVIEFTPEGGEPIDLSKFTPKYSDEIKAQMDKERERLFEERTRNLERGSFTFSGFFQAPQPEVSHYQQCRARDHARLLVLQKIERDYTGPLGFINPRGEVRRRRGFFATLTWAQQMEFMMYHTRNRSYLN